MEIKVIYHDNSAGVVRDYLLEDLLRSGKVIAFRRAEGWVTVGSDPVRQCLDPYAGPERRRRGTIATFFG